MERFFAERKITLYASGTAALAAALSACVQRAAIDRAEIIMPAYGCPDLIAACLYAGATPRLVDVSHNCWSYDLQALRHSLTDRTIAVVAVNLLGLGDGATSVRDLCQQHSIALIQDSAQYLPREPFDWPGDSVILSFGRGKPLNLLYGGALIGSRDDSRPAPLPSTRAPIRDRLLDTRAAGLAFNLLTLPHPFWLLSHLPGTGLGTVRYNPLAASEATPLPEHAWTRVGPAFAQYCHAPSYSRRIWADAIEEWRAFGVDALRGPEPMVPLEPLRLALLAPDRIARDGIVDRLSRSHLGASRFYGVDLPRIGLIPECVRQQGPFPNAARLADRLYTIPTHSLVGPDAIQLARQIMRSWQRSRRAP
ncbi:MAG: DegT/DnrJ/EryC1/StrS family aminotransferase [Pseudomonadota bacterium]|nr:DegT/DnrJ/EryC1/StrS family aminotransferase [Pseudomonadota bacterium]